jgi:glutathione S-transferase
MLKLHFAPNSRAGRILWLLEELQLEYELNKMKFHPSDLKSDQHRERHPLGRVPVLEDGDVSIYESGAIVEYILSRHAPGKLKPEISSNLFPSYLQWFHYCEGMVMPPINIIVVQTILLPKERQNAEALGQAERLLSKTLAPIEKQLNNKEYILGDFSAVDIMLGHACFMANRLGRVEESMNNLRNYIKNIESRSAFKKAINT